MKRVLLIFCTLFLLTSAFAAPSADPSLTVIYPNGGEYLSGDVNIIFSLSGFSLLDWVTIDGFPTDSNLYNSEGVLCDDFDFLDSTICYYVWDTSLVGDGSEKVTVTVSGLNLLSSTRGKQDESNSNFIVDNTKPTISNPIPSKWVNPNITELTIDINDNLSNVNSSEVLFTLNSVAYSGVYDYSTNKASLDLTGLGLLDGNTYTVKVDANDNSKNSATQFSYNLTVDMTSPSLTTIDVNSLINNSNPTIDLNAFDAISGIKGVKYSCDGTNWTNLISITSFPNQNTDFNILDSTYGCNANEGDKNIFVTFIDNADNNSTPIYETITYDSTIPTSIISFSPSVLDYSDTNVTINCSDSLGINRIDYNLNGDFNSINANTLTLNITSDGNNEIIYSCVDSANNNNGLNYVYVPIDKISPSPTTLTLDDAQKDTNVLLTWTKVNDFSDINKYIVYKRDSNSSLFVAVYFTSDTNYLDSNNISDTNEQYCYFVQTIDNVLHDSNSSTKCIFIDTISPLMGSLTESVTSKDVKLTFSATDTNGSGVKGYYISMDKNSWIYTTNSNYTYTNLDNGNYTFYVKAIDNADNNSSDFNVLATVNYTAPKKSSGGSGSRRTNPTTTNEPKTTQSDTNLIESTTQTIVEPMPVIVQNDSNLVIESVSNNSDLNDDELVNSNATGLFGFGQLTNRLFPFFLLLILLLTILLFVIKRRKEDGSKLYYNN